MNSSPVGRGLKPRLPRFENFRLPRWASLAALAFALVLAWANFLTTGRFAALPGALHGWREPWYAASLVAATALTLTGWRKVGQPVDLKSPIGIALLLAGAGVLVAAVLGRLPPGTWLQLPWKDDWTELFTQASNGVALLKRGVFVGWNWWLLGGYPTSTDIAQNFALVAFVPMTIFGDRLGYHLLHVGLFFLVPIYVWLDLRHEDRQTRLVGSGLACFFAAGYSGQLGSSGDTNSLVGVACAALAMTGGHAARRGTRWGGPLMCLGLTLAVYTHTAFAVYAGIYLTVEAIYFRDRAAFIRVAFASGVAVIAALPMHWESLRHAAFVSFNNTVYDPHAPMDWPAFLRTIYYNVEILLLPHRWFNDYRSLANVWLPALIVTALLRGRSRTSFFAWSAVVTQLLLRVNTAEAGALFDRAQHMLPLLTAPALAGFVVRTTGGRPLAVAVLSVVGLYVASVHVPVRHVTDLRSWNPPLMDRIARADGMVLVEISPHRDMDSHPTRRSQTTPFDVHFEGLLPRLAGQRFYSQMIDGWNWTIWRGQVVGAGTFRGRPIAETPVATFVTEMEHWGVRHLFVWTDATRDYLTRSGAFVERWRDGTWSHFEHPGADVRTVVATTGHGVLTDLDTLGAAVNLSDVEAGSTIVIRANYYPAWRARVGDRDVPLFSQEGQLAFHAPAGGTYVVRLEYPRYRWLSLTAITAFLFGYCGH